MTTADRDPGSPLRVLLVHNRYQQAGGEDAVFGAQAELLESRGHPVERLEVDNASIPERSGIAGRLGLAARTIWSRDGAGRIREAARRFRPDIVHAHNTFPLLSPAVHGAAHREGAATVQAIHNYRLVCPSANLFRDGRPCHDCVGLPVAVPGIVHGCYRGSRAASATVAAMLAVHAARNTWTRDVDQLVALTAFARDRLVEGGIPAGRISVQPNYVDLPVTPPDGPGDGFLFVGRLTADKGVETLLEAWERLPPGIELRIAGGGPLEERVRRAADASPAVSYLGRLDPVDVRAEMRRSRAVLAPSHWYEGFPLVVLEAFAAGRPVIAAGHGSLAEVVADGLTGLWVRPGDAADLAARVAWAASHPAELLEAGRRAQAELLGRYTPEHGYRGLLEVYHKARTVRAARRRARAAGSRP